ncbi:MAG: hypothetical protein IPP47_28600 [Bryobacterales bacterium]|nr:hypothetical protein [Bryobacterales bacterium]
MSRQPALEHEWRFPARGIAIRLFLTCWMIYGLHFATNIVREIYLGLAIGDHLSFRVDEYGGMHDDLFETPGRGWHIGNNPGASMLGAVPYAVARPLVDRVVAQVNRQRAASGAQPPAYSSPWPKARQFFADSWRRGYDVKFALAALVMQVFCMAPFSAASVVLMFFVLRRLGATDRQGAWLALLYAFGTPVFFRTGFLNQNMLVGYFALAGFAALWLWGTRNGAVVAGLAAGTCVLLDYSGGVIAAGLLVYCLLRQRVRLVAFVAGSIPPVLLLWFYQWQSFGHPFYPGQHWMPPVEWSELGYQGVGGPQMDLAWQLVFDYRFGLFLSCPLLLLAFAAVRLRGVAIPRFELATLLGIFAGFWLFFSTVNYTRIQYNTGVRYMAPMIPLLFVPAALVLLRMKRGWVYGLAVGAVTQAWCMAMYRDVERGLGLGEPLLRVFTGGFQLPVLSTLARLGGGSELTASGVSPLPLFALTGAVLFGLWRRWA